MREEQLATRWPENLTLVLDQSGPYPSGKDSDIDSVKQKASVLCSVLLVESGHSLNRPNVGCLLCG